MLFEQDLSREGLLAGANTSRLASGVLNYSKSRHRNNSVPRVACDMQPFSVGRTTCFEISWMEEGGASSSSIYANEPSRIKH